MDIKVELVKQEPGLEGTNFIIKIENVNESTPIGDIKTENDTDIEEPIINKLLLKNKFDGDIKDISKTNVEVKKEIDEPEIMDIKVELVKQEPGLEGTNFIIKIENVNGNTPIGDIKTENDMDIEEPIINKLLLKKEFDGDIKDISETNVEVKKEIDESSSDEEDLLEIKPEELMLKSDSADGEDDDIGVHTGSNEQDKKSVKKYSCHLCGFVAHEQSTVTRHILSEHDNESVRKLQCDFCNYSTCREWCLKLHVQKKHSGKKYSKEFCCALCDYSSKQNARLKLHVLSKHNNETAEKFKCDICDFESCIKYAVKRHMKKKHNKGTKDHFCDVCDFQTYNKGYLQTHKLVKHHKDLVGTYACEDCSFRTHHKSYLNKHQMMKHK